MFLQKIGISLLLFFYCSLSSAQSLQAQEHLEEEVRIGLRFTAFSQALAAQEMPRIIKPQSIERFVLKARLAQEDDFYFHKFHVRSQPQRQNKNGLYSVRLSFSQRNAQGREDLLGAMELAGLLHRKGSSYELHGLAEKRFDNAAGEPILNVLAGFRASTQSLTSSQTAGL